MAGASGQLTSIGTPAAVGRSTMASARFYGRGKRCSISCAMPGVLGTTFETCVELLAVSASSTCLANSAIVKGFFISLRCSHAVELRRTNVTCHVAIGRSGRLAETTRVDLIIPFISGMAISTMSNSMQVFFSIISIARGPLLAARTRYPKLSRQETRSSRTSRSSSATRIVVLGQYSRDRLLLCFVYRKAECAWQINGNSCALAKARIDPTAPPVCLAIP